MYLYIHVIDLKGLKFTILQMLSVYQITIRLTITIYTIFSIFFKEIKLKIQTFWQLYIVILIMVEYHYKMEFQFLLR